MTGSSGKPEACEHLSDISNSIPSGMVTVDRESKIDWYNDVWSRDLKAYFSHDIATGIPFFTLLPDEQIEKMIAEALAGKTVERYCYRFEHQRQSSKDRTYDVMAFPIRSAGKITGATLMVTDATERYRKIRGMESAKNEAEFYVDLMSHDIRNFNQITMGYIELLQLAEHLDDTERSYLEKAMKGVTGSNKLIDNIKKIRLIRQYAGKSLEKMSLNEVIKKDAADVRSASPSAKIDLNFSTDIDRSVLADDYIHEIFRHIMENAVKYDPHEEQVIDVAIGLDDKDGRKYWSVSIADHGAGIPDDKKRSIFERMRTTTRGMGVGLSIVSVLVNKYGGNIYVRDRVAGQPSQGSVFTVELPVV